MKKCTFAIAALAVVLFAGCNKEENTIKMTVGGEVAQSTEKEAWCAGLNQVMFSDGDAIILTETENGFPGEQYALTPNPTAMPEYDQVYAGRDGFSYYADFEISRTCVGDSIYAYFPAEAFAEGVASLNTGLPATLVEYSMEDETEVLALTDGFWPMVGYLPTVNEQSNMFYLYNTTALITPAVKYGRNFLIGMGITDHVPVLDVQEITFSSNVALGGTGHIENGNTANPAYSAAQRNCTLVLDSNLVNEITVVPTVNNIVEQTVGQYIPIIGNIAMPVMSNAQLSVRMLFTLDGVLYEYTKTVENVALQRNQRTTVIINLFDDLNSVVNAGTVTRL